ncbi:MAG TPA: hydantoinase B/oxoprolinase family protein, partial [Dehalococcoidia bacterium]|nr:hydantoinase B/oxoprolinase family protein [Dehalococcoidia bacterium]
YRSTTVSVEGQEVVRPYKAVCALTKKGDQLVFDTTGSSPQNVDQRNSSYVCTWSKLFEALAGFVFWDLPWNQGMTVPVKLVAPEGTILNCKYPASCGLGTLIGGHFAGAAMDCIARMMYSGGHREDVNASWRGNKGDGGPYFWYGGHNQYGGVVGQGIYDLFGGGQGATPTRDGNHTGGIAESAQSCISDVEFTEMYFPFLYLSRRQMTDGGGPGKFAGGMGPESVMMVYGTKDLSVDYVPAPISSQVTGAGLFGGYPMGTGLEGNKVLKTQDMMEKVQDGCYPTSLEEAEGDWGVDVRKSPGHHIERQLGGVRLPVGEHDILCYQISCGSGYGDPLERDITLIEADLQNLVLTPEAAARVYGVVTRESAGQIDPEATKARRRQIREERLLKAAPLTQGGDTGHGRLHEEVEQELLRIHEYLAIVRTTDGRKLIACTSCGHQFCGAAENYKVHAVRWTRDVAEMKKVPAGEETFAYYQEYICPGCATLLQVDIWYPSLDTDEPLWDIHVDTDVLDGA